MVLSVLGFENFKILRRNPSEVTGGQNPSTKIIYIVMQTSVRLL